MDLCGEGTQFRLEIVLPNELIWTGTLTRMEQEGLLSMCHLALAILHFLISWDLKNMAIFEASLDFQ